MTAVGYKLRREIEDLFPAKTTPAERLAGLEIAEYGSETTRISLITLPLLCARCGLEETGIRAVLRRLAGRGLEFRISHGEGRDGRLVYASRGRPPEYRVPAISEFTYAWKLAEGVTTVTPSVNGHLAGKPP
jgi:hypothetical protein